MPVASGAAADRVIGQAFGDFATVTAATTATGVDGPTGIYAVEDGATDKIYVNFTCDGQPLGSMIATSEQPKFWLKVDGTAIDSDFSTSRYLIRPPHQTR